MKIDDRSIPGTSGGSGNTADQTRAETRREMTVSEVQPLAAVPGLGNVQAQAVNIGSSPTKSLLLFLNGFRFTNDRPEVVLVQTRQAFPLQDAGFPDVFATQVIKVDRTSILMRILRLDTAEDIGWGQQLEVDMLFVDRRVGS